MISLPVDEVLPALLAGLAQHGVCVLSAPPGSGKTTRVPGAIIDAGLQGEVWVLQPRRLAARSAARRVAAERGSGLGDEVGYQVRFDTRAGKSTRIRFVTEGILVRQLVRDPFLPGVGAVVLDEFHERSLEADLALAMLTEIRETVREDLQLVVMSATLDNASVSAFLAPCGVVEADGRLHDVRVEHLPGRGELDARVSTAVRQALEETVGDVLVFLPGVREIAACQAALSEMAGRRGLLVLPLHGQLAPDQQDAAILSGDQRKVVLATNVAETSVTIEGVTAVVDSGLARVLRHDPGRGLDRLELTTIRRASAEQRRGRAGRTAPGVCYRLWSLAEERGMPAFETPEIRRLDLAGLVLQVRAFAGRDPGEFGWFESPEPQGLAQANELLELLGAVADGQVTELGHAMLRHPLHPRLGRMFEEGRRRGFPWAAAELAALLSEREIQGRQRGAADLLDTRSLLHQVEAAGFGEALGRRLGVDVRAARAVVRVRDQLARGGRDRAEPSDEDLIKMLLSAYPDRVSKRDNEQTVDGVMASGRGCRLTMQDHENLGDLFLSLRVRESGNRQQSRSQVSVACALREEWLSEVFPAGIREEESVEFDTKSAAVVVRKRTVFGQVALSERTGGRPDPSQAAAMLSEAVAKDPWRYLGAQEELRGFLARLHWLREQALLTGSDDGGFPAIGDAEVVAAVAVAGIGSTRLSELVKVPILGVLQSALPPGIVRRVAMEAPERIELPSGRKARIDYSGGAEPFVAARLQEFFGLADTPRLAGGRVPLLLHLLAPNHRPVQITRDLASFWETVYPGVRSELRRRYPRHAWPENPQKAAPESRPKRRR